MTRIRETSTQILVALGLSLMIWIFVTFTTNPDVRETFTTPPVTVNAMSSDLVIMNPETGLPRQDQDELSPVDVQISTDQRTLSALNSSDFAASVSLDTLGAGTHLVPVDVAVPSDNVRILAVEPEELSIRLESVVTSTVPITIDVIGSPPFSYERGEPSVSSDNEDIEQVEITGPLSLVERVNSVGATVNIEQLQSTFVSTISLVPYDANGDPVEGVTSDPEQVNVRIEIQPVVGLKRVPIIGNVVSSPANGYIIAGVRSNPQLINIIGSSELLNQIDQIETEPIDVSGATSTLTETAALRFQGAQPQSSDITTATVTIEITPLNQPFQVQVPVPVQVVNANENLMVSVEPTVIPVTLEGTITAFEQLRADELQATVDVSGLGPGTYQLTPALQVPTNIAVTSALSSVTVTLELAPAPPAASTPIPQIIDPEDTTNRVSPPATPDTEE
jgi:YbbR domain-containing protein